MKKANSGGYITLVLIFFALLLAFFLFPRKYPNPNAKSSLTFEFCEVVDPKDAPIITGLPDYLPIKEPGIENSSAVNVQLLDTVGDYRMIRRNYPVNVSTFSIEHLRKLEDSRGLVDGGLGQVYLPTEYAAATIEPDKAIRLWRIVAVQRLNPDKTPKTYRFIDGNDYFLFDIYQKEGVEAPPSSTLLCKDVSSKNGTAQPADTGKISVIVPSQVPSTDNQQLQLEWFLFGAKPSLKQKEWFLTCKPAIYLYPKEKTLVNVKVSPQGYLTMSIPQYDASNGWNVIASPDGNLSSINDKQLTINDYPYLYYESKIKDEVINKPTKGWVVPFDQLVPLYQEILPKLGLNTQQTQDFITYWNKALTYSPYYFVGIIDQENVNQIEPLLITPKPDYLNRVRIYFERLDAPKQVETPDLNEIGYWKLDMSEAPASAVGNSQLRVTEWGGMVKQDKDHPFTCSQ